MNKKQLSSFFNKAPKEQWVSIPIDPMLMTAETILRSKETETQINQWIEDYLSIITSKPLFKKIKSYKGIVIWPQEDEEPFRPHVSSASLFRYSATKYTLVLTVKHYEYVDE